jgi:hypothetical protein
MYVEPAIKPVILRSTAPTFLSKLEDFNQRSSSQSIDSWENSAPDITVAEVEPTASDGNTHCTDDEKLHQKVIRWGAVEANNSDSEQIQDEKLQHATIPSHTIGQEAMIELGSCVLSLAEKEKEINPTDQDKQANPSGNDKPESKRRSRSKSLSKRTRSQSRSKNDSKDPAATKTEKKERTPQWDALLNRSSSSFRFDATDFEDKGGCIPIEPLMSPVVLKNKIIELSPSKIIDKLGMKDDIVSSPQRKYMEKILHETKKKTVESKMRQLQLTASTDSKATHHDRRVLPNTDVSKEEKTSNTLAAMERLRKANELILAKKKRREESRARQKNLERYDSKLSSTISMDMAARKSSADAGIDKSEIQLTPSVVEGRTLVSAGSSFKLKETKNAGTSSVGMEMPGRAEVHSISGDDENHIQKSSRWKGVKKGIERISRSNRILMPNSIPKASEATPVELSQESQDTIKGSQEKSRVRRRERRAGRETSDSKIPENATDAPSSKWKELSTRAGSLRKPTSAKWGNLKKSLDATTKRISKDNGLKQSSDDARKNMVSGDSNIKKGFDEGSKPVSSDRSLLDSPTKPNKWRLSAGGDVKDLEQSSPGMQNGKSKWGALKGGVNFISRLKGGTTALGN